MWYPATVTSAPATEPVTVEETKRRLRVDFSDDDADLAAYIASVRDHVEKYCNLRLITQTIVLKCDNFGDLARLPDAPIQSITSITYIDAAGDEATLDTSVYELRSDVFEAGIVLKYGQVWPSRQNGSRITVTAVAGYAEVPPSIKHAMLVYIGETYEFRENVKVEDWTVFDSLLINYRRGS